MDLQQRYDRPDDEELLEEYVKAVPLVTTNDENRLRSKIVTLEDREKEIETIKMRNEESTRQIQTLLIRLQSKDMEIGTLGTKDRNIEANLESKDKQIQELSAKMARIEESQLKIAELRKIQ